MTSRFFLPKKDVAVRAKKKQFPGFFFCLFMDYFFISVSGDVALSEIAGPFSAADVATDCSSGVLKQPLLWLISYALMAVCAVILIVLLLLLLLPCRRRGRLGEITDESSLVRHRIKWLGGARRVSAANGQEAGRGEAYAARPPWRTTERPTDLAPPSWVWLFGTPLPSEGNIPPWSPPETSDGHAHPDFWSEHRGTVNVEKTFTDYDHLSIWIVFLENVLLFCLLWLYESRGTFQGFENIFCFKNKQTSKPGNLRKDSENVERKRSKWSGPS